MGRDTNESETQARHKKKTKRARNGGGNFLTYHPTVREREELAAHAPAIDAAWSRLAKLIQEDVSLTIGFKPENHSYFLILRNKALDWTEDTPLSFWHQDYEKLVRMACYAIDTKFAGYPFDLPPAEDYLTDDW